MEKLEIEMQQLAPHHSTLSNTLSGIPSHVNFLKMKLISQNTEVASFSNLVHFSIALRSLKEITFRPRASLDTYHASSPTHLEY